MAASIVGVQAYSLIKEPAHANITGVQAYVLYKEPSRLGLRQINGYALVSDIPLPKGVTGIDALTNLILAQSNIPRSANQFIVDPPASYSGPETVLHNTRVQVTAVPTSLLQGSMYFYYSRVSLIRIPAALTAIVIGSATSTHGLIAAINSASGMVLTTDDLVDSPITPGATSATITAAATSRFFLPGDTVQVGFT